MIEGVVAVFVAKIPPEGASLPLGGQSVTLTPDLGGLLAGAPSADVELPCSSESADLWFAERPDQLGRAQALCRECPIKRQCLDGALNRREPWGVWGGEIFERGRVIPFKRGRGRPTKIQESTVA